METACNEAKQQKKITQLDESMAALIEHAGSLEGRLGSALDRARMSQPEEAKDTPSEHVPEESFARLETRMSQMRRVLEKIDNHATELAEYI